MSECLLIQKAYNRETLICPKFNGAMYYFERIATKVEKELPFFTQGNSFSIWL
jgi:hypothetical protein